MSKVQLRMPSGITGILKDEVSDWFVLEKEVAEGATIADLLVGLTSSDDSFLKVVFNPDTGKVGDQIMVFLNENLLQGPKITAIKLKDGDTVMLLPIYAGG
ncbi:MAG: MoaD/ThiS family protein [Chloroflexi bacterium]|nr:MoaD/ThiS family protein [Chloroflexota bacterium]